MPKMTMEKIQRSGKVIWATLHNQETGKAKKQHAFIYEDKSLSDTFPVPILGNISLCGVAEIFDDKGISELLEDIGEETLNEECACKKCLAIFHIIPINIFDKWAHLNH